MNGTSGDDRPMGGSEVDDVMSAPGPPEVRRDRRDHGGAPVHLDDDALAKRTEQERLDAGLVDYDPAGVPPATDEPLPTDVTNSDAYQDELAEAQREARAGEVLLEGGDEDMPPTQYDRS